MLKLANLTLYFLKKSHMLGIRDFVKIAQKCSEYKKNIGGPRPILLNFVQDGSKVVRICSKIIKIAQE